MLWYVAYGSNLDPALLARHLAGETPDSRWLTTDHPLWFGGWSRRWSGGVAFLGLEPTGARTPCRAYRVELEALAGIFRSENLTDAPLPPLPEQPGAHALADLKLSADGTRGKYDALLRLPDLEGLPAVTITTARNLPRRDPAPAYAEAIRVACLRARSNP